MKRLSWLATLLVAVCPLSACKSEPTPPQQTAAAQLPVAAMPKIDQAKDFAAHQGALIQRVRGPSTGHQRRRAHREVHSGTAAKLEGSDAQLKDEYVVYSAHNEFKAKREEALKK